MFGNADSSAKFKGNYRRLLDFAQGVPTQVVRAGNGQTSSCENSYAFSTDGGQTWGIGSAQPSGVTGSNNDSIAISPDGKRVVWAPNGTAAAYTSINWTSNKAAWTAVSGLPAQANVRADRVTASKFYGFSNGVFYVSTNGTIFTTTVSPAFQLRRRSCRSITRPTMCGWSARIQVHGEYGTRPTAEPVSPS